MKTLHETYEYELIINTATVFTSFRVLFFLPFCHSRKIFNDHFVTARVDSGVAFSIKLLSSSAFLGFRIAQEQDAMSSSVRPGTRRTLVELNSSNLLILK